MRRTVIAFFPMKKFGEVDPKVDFTDLPAEKLRYCLKYMISVLLAKSSGLLAYALMFLNSSVVRS